MQASQHSPQHGFALWFGKKAQDKLIALCNYWVRSQQTTKRIQSKKKRKKLFYYYYHHSFSSHGSGWNEWKWMHDELQTIEENDALSTEKNITKQ